MTIEVVPASVVHVGPIATRMREIDKLECAIMGRGPKRALRQSLAGSTVAWTVKINGRAEAMMGAAAVSTLDGIGSPWLLMTDEAVRHARVLVVLGRGYSDAMQGLFRVLENNVHADNDVSIRWLSRLGYTIGPVFDMNGHPMRRFRREKNLVRSDDLGNFFGCRGDGWDGRFRR